MSQNLNFGQAVEALKNGQRVTRSGWNGKGMFLLLIKGSAVTESINACYSSDKKEDELPVSDVIYMKTVTNELVAWSPSQTDILFEDWQIV